MPNKPIPNRIKVEEEMNSIIDSLDGLTTAADTEATDKYRRTDKYRSTDKYRRTDKSRGFSRRIVTSQKFLHE